MKTWKILLVLISASVTAQDGHFKTTQCGKEYKGNLSVTKDGKKCHRWDSLTSPKAYVKAANFPDGTLKDAANYCRNPDDDPTGPWCYTGDSRNERQHCDVKLKTGEHFMTTLLGGEYKGSLAVTKDGKKCLRWDSLTHHQAPSSAAKFPDATLQDAANYCRNPGEYAFRPFCYTGDSALEQQDCDVKLKTGVKCQLGKGATYAGTVSKTKGGKSCLPWAKSTLARRETSDANFPEGCKAAAKNYCRNPHWWKKAPWCYYGIKECYPRSSECWWRTKWDYCDVPHCDGPYKTTQYGREYKGNLSVTKDGKKCVRWSSLTNPKAFVKAANFPDLTLKDAANYCRNPDDASGGPWCYTDDSRTEWQYCDVKLKTDGHYKTTQHGREYMGNLSLTKDGKKCVRWDSLTNPKASIKAANFPDTTLKEAANYCRNPDDGPHGPWCYTGDSRNEWQYCDVKLKTD